MFQGIPVITIFAGIFFAFSQGVFQPGIVHDLIQIITNPIL